MFRVFYAISENSMKYIDLFFTLNLRFELITNYKLIISLNKHGKSTILSLTIGH